MRGRQKLSLVEVVKSGVMIPVTANGCRYYLSFSACFFFSAPCVQMSWLIFVWRQLGEFSVVENLDTLDRTLELQPKYNTGTSKRRTVNFIFQTRRPDRTVMRSFLVKHSFYSPPHSIAKYGDHEYDKNMIRLTIMLA